MQALNWSSFCTGFHPYSVFFQGHPVTDSLLIRMPTKRCAAKKAVKAEMKSRTSRVAVTALAKTRILIHPSVCNMQARKQTDTLAEEKLVQP